MKQYLQPILRSVQSKSEKRGKCFVIAFTASYSKEGVSYVAQSFGMELARLTGKQTLIADVRRLQSLSTMDLIRMPHCCSQTDIPNLWVLPQEQDDVEGTLPPSPQGALRLRLDTEEDDESEFELGYIPALRMSFDYVLIDCPALSVSEDAAMLASSVDGVVVVVEADRTKGAQVKRTQQTLETANGNLLGFVLNKRRYPVPEWLYKRL